jgi:hypothetical protein
MIIGIGIGVAFNTGGGAARWAPYPAPTGYFWDFVTSSGRQVTAVTTRSASEPVVALMRAN